MNPVSTQVLPGINQVEFFPGNMAIFRFNGSTGFLDVRNFVRNYNWKIRWRLATASDLTIFSWLNPAQQKISPIAALGSIIGGEEGLHVPVIFGDDSNIIQVRFIQPIFLNYGILAMEQTVDIGPDLQ